MPEFYWCQQCETKFLAESTHREFKQAICKQCSATCSDFEFEIDEAERIQEAEENGDVALGALLTALFGLFGFVWSQCIVPWAILTNVVRGKGRVQR